MFLTLHLYIRHRLYHCRYNQLVLLIPLIQRGMTPSPHQALIDVGSFTTCDGGSLLPPRSQESHLFRTVSVQQ